MNCNHQNTYFDEDYERCRDCGAVRLPGRAKWLMRKRHPTSLPKKENK